MHREGGLWRGYLGVLERGPDLIPASGFPYRDYSQAFPTFVAALWWCICGDLAGGDTPRLGLSAHHSMHRQKAVVCPAGPFTGRFAAP